MALAPQALPGEIGRAMMKILVAVVRSVAADGACGEFAEAADSGVWVWVWDLP
ncbi:hypothetical protein COLO4_07977 [Corchorus olitorius]|uniref:Uncharacterized protein n=1 Tax=Corchorus olitorius TaxID=93759 RepID=A0A1R3KHW1_9ROSI|nr:hypothetical protein COLO4_07977 [Corchorus olitorius]